MLTIEIDKHRPHTAYDTCIAQLVMLRDLFSSGGDVELSPLAICGLMDNLESVVVALKQLQTLAHHNARQVA